jgi:hypothetical protein
MADSTDWAKYVRDINTSGSTGWVAKPKYNYVPTWDGSMKGYKVLPCTPKLPSGRVWKPKDDDNTELVKTADLANFIESYMSTQPNYAEEEAFAFVGLTGNDILQTSYTSNYYINNNIVNVNVLNSVNTTNSIKPTELIKLQKSNSRYFTTILSGYTTSIDTKTGVATVTIRKAGTSASYKVQVQTFTPKAIKNATIY